MVQNWSTSTVTSLSADTEPSILVTFDNAKYLFNVGENINRAMLQKSNQNWKKMKGVFVTRIGSQRMSGLAGVIMSLADAAIKNLNIIGPPGILHFIASLRMFLFREQLAVQVIEHNPNSSNVRDIAYKDENVTVYTFPITTAAADSGEGTNESESMTEPDTSKRKRELSEERSVKIPKISNDVGTKASEGRDAQGVRRNALNEMFAKPPKPSGELKGPVIVDDYRRCVGTWFYEQLPRFHYARKFDPRDALAYIVVGPRMRGRVDGKKLEELGVPHNSLRRKLSQGETIEFDVQGPNGVEKRVVRPEDCMSPSEAPGVVIILDVATQECIPSVTKAFDSVYKQFRSNDPVDSEEYSVKVVYHLLGPGVMEDGRYLKFMNGFSSATQHFVSAREYCPDLVTFTSHAFNQYRLHKLDSQMFPLPRFNMKASKNISDIPNLPKNIAPLTSTLTVTVRPSRPIEYQTLASNDRFHPVIQAAGPLVLSEETTTAFKKAREEVEKFRPHIHVTQTSQPVKIISLGTGSAVPTKYRNVLSTIVMTSSGNILLDAGEGTWGQLARFFGDDSMNGHPSVYDILRDLKCIFVSHAHADHHLGLAKILRQRALLDPPPKHQLYVVSIRQVQLYLKEQNELEPLGLSSNPESNGVIQVMSDALNYAYSAYPEKGRWRVGGNEPWLDLELSRAHATQMCQNLDLRGFRAVNVFHNAKAFGVCIESLAGWSIVFSGDTMPTNNLSRIARRPTVLIHEASMSDDEAELARVKAHSTTGQAIQIARDMKAENVLLTHFSARYPRLNIPSITPRSDEDHNEHQPMVAIAFDHACFDMNEMWKMNFYIPAIEQSFLETVEEGDADLHASAEEAVVGDA